MIRKTLLVISIVLLLGTVGLCVRSYHEYPNPDSYGPALSYTIGERRVFWFGKRWVLVAAYAGRLVVGSDRQSPGWPRPHGPFEFSYTPSIFSFARAGPRHFQLKLPIASLVALFSLYPSLVVARGALVRCSRRDRGLCLVCSYDLTGNVSGVCPECGGPMADRAGRDAAMIRKTLVLITVVLLAASAGLWVHSYWVGSNLVGWWDNRIAIRDGELVWSQASSKPDGVKGGQYVSFTVYSPYSPRLSLPLSIPAGILAVAACVLARPIIRLRHNLCLKCGYNLTGNVSGVCSECGTAVETGEKARTERCRSR